MSTNERTVAIGCDHGGFDLKNQIIRHLEEKGIKYIYFGCNSTASTDYPIYAKKVCESIQSGECSIGILVCGTGLGMSMTANKFRGIRAACCSDTFSARLTRMHNDANILCLGGRVVGAGLALDMVDLFLGTEFEGGRHAKRVAMMMENENK